MKYERRPTKQFKKDVKRLAKRRYDLSSLEALIDMLAEDAVLPASYCDHPLRGYGRDIRECHIDDDWVLVYQKTETSLYLYLIRTGTHQDVFPNY